MERNAPHRLAPADVHPTLRRSILADGLPLVLDLDASSGSQLVDALTGETYLDLFSFFGSNALGLNHPGMTEPEMVAELGRVAVHKPSNSDLYTVAMAEFVATFARVLGDPRLPHLFFVEGGALAVENALKVAFDYKSRLNESRGLSPALGSRVLHLQYAFHGRTGYTLSLTNTDPVKTARFPRFDWPRLTSPYLGTYPDGRPRPVEALEAQTLAEAERAFALHGADIACFIAEPIQSEGGDHHFRPQFLQAMQQLVHDHDALFIVDEVQTGVGMSGTPWAYQQLGLEPDVVAFGKKTQVCGVMAGGKVDEVADNVFQVSSRINSTWGGNLVDMVRARRTLEIIEAEGLIARAGEVGGWLLAELHSLAARQPLVLDPRGRGLLCAFSLPDSQTRDTLVAELGRRHVLILGCGERSVRFRPALTVSADDLRHGLAAIDETLSAMTLAIVA